MQGVFVPRGLHREFFHGGLLDGGFPPANVHLRKHEHVHERLILYFKIGCQ